MRGESVRRRIESMEQLPSLNQQNNAGSSGSSRAIENAYSFTWYLLNERTSRITWPLSASSHKNMCHFYVSVVCFLQFFWLSSPLVAITTSAYGLQITFKGFCFFLVISKDLDKIPSVPSSYCLWLSQFVKASTSNVMYFMFRLTDNSDRRTNISLKITSAWLLVDPL